MYARTWSTMSEMTLYLAHVRTMKGEHPTGD